MEDERVSREVASAVGILNDLMRKYGVGEEYLIECVLVARLLAARGMECRVISGYILLNDRLAIRHVWIQIPPDFILDTSSVHNKGKYSFTLPDESSMRRCEATESILGRASKIEDGVCVVSDYKTVIECVAKDSPKWVRVSAEMNAIGCIEAYNRRKGI